MTSLAYEQAISLIDTVNQDDPNTEIVEGKEWPKELLYSVRMSEMLQRFKPDADPVIKLAVRGQHIQRWEYPRDSFPLDRKGYHQW